MNYKSFIGFLLLGATALGISAVHAAQDAEVKKPEVTTEKPVVVPPAMMQITPGLTGDYLSGQFAKSSGDIQGAIRYLQRAYKSAPNDIGVASQLEGLLLLDGRVEEAMVIAANINQKNADPVSTLLATLYEVKKGNMDKAAQSLQPAFASDGGQVWLPLISAWIDIGRRTFNKPITIDAINTSVTKTAPIVRYHLALINAHGGFKEAAIADFKATVSEIKNPPGRILAMLNQFYEKNGSPAELKSYADDYQKNKTETLDDAPIVNTTKDGIAEVLYTMGSVMQIAGITQDAVIYLQLALYLQPQSTAAAMGLGDAYSELRKFDKANAVYAKIPVSSRTYNKAQMRMASNFNHVGKSAEALALLEKLYKTNPKAADVLVAKADLLRIRGRYGDAITNYTKAIEIISDLKPFHWPILFARGVSYEHVGKWEQAEVDLQHALKLTPDQPDVLNYLGYSWLTRGTHLDEAREMIAKAVKARPNDAQIVDSMGWGLYLAGKYEEATEYLEKAVDLLPGDATVNDHLGDVYWRLGRKTEARYQWERSLLYSPEPPLAENIKKKLKDGLPPDAKVAKGSPAITHAMSSDPSENVATTE